MIAQLNERAQDELKRLVQSLDHKEDAGAAQEALDIAKTALGVCRQVYGATHAETAELLSRVALCHEALHRMQDAETFYRKAIRVAEQALGASHPGVTPYLDNLATLLGRLGLRSERDGLRTRIRHLHAQSLLPSDPLVSGMLYNASMADARCGDAAVPAAVVARCIQGAESMYGAGLAGAELVAALARIFAEDGIHGISRALCEAASAWAEDDAGADAQGCAALYREIATTYVEQGDFMNARLYRRKATDLSTGLARCA